MTGQELIDYGVSIGWLSPEKAEELKKLLEPEWKDASKRPPREGRYLVWGLHEFTPDHCDEPNAYWQTRIACWSNRWGWDTKVKYWRELPDVPIHWQYVDILEPPKEQEAGEQDG